MPQNFPCLRLVASHLSILSTRNFQKNCTYPVDLNTTSKDQHLKSYWTGWCTNVRLPYATQRILSSQDFKNTSLCSSEGQLNHRGILSITILQSRSRKSVSPTENWGTVPWSFILLVKSPNWGPTESSLALAYCCPHSDFQNKALLRYPKSLKWIEIIDSVIYSGGVPQFQPLV